MSKKMLFVMGATFVLMNIPISLAFLLSGISPWGNISLIVVGLGMLLAYYILTKSEGKK